MYLGHGVRRRAKRSRIQYMIGVPAVTTLGISLWRANSAVISGKGRR